MIASTSAQYTFSPARRIMSVTRSSTNTNPSSSTRPMSPVRSQPSTMAAAVASGRFQYPRMRLGPANQISPTSPVGRSLPSGSRTATCITGSTRPALRGLRK